jgi:prevent-host-death family protein
MVLTMVKKAVAPRTMTISEFRAKCLALMDEVDETGVTITVTRRGKVVGELRPVTAEERRLFAEGKLEEWRPSRDRARRKRKTAI